MNEEIKNNYVDRFVDEIGDNKILMWDGPYSPISVLFSWNDQNLYSSIYRTPASPVLEVIKDREALLLFNDSYYKSYSKEIFDLYIKNTERFSEINKKSLDVSKEINDLYALFQNEDLTKLPDDQLSKYVLKMNSLLSGLQALTIHVETFDKEIVTSVLGNDKVGSIDLIWDTATHPCFESFDLRRLKMSLEEIKGKSGFDSKYIQFVYTDYFASKDLAEVKSLLKDKFGSQDLISSAEKNILLLTKELQNKKQEYDAWFGALSEDDKKLAWYIQTVMEIRDWRKDPIAQAQTLFYGVSVEKLSRVNIDIKLAPYFLPKELENNVDWFVHEKEQIQKRPNGLLVYMSTNGLIEVEAIDFSKLASSIRTMVLKREKIGETLTGQVGSKGFARGVVRIIKDASLGSFNEGEVLVTGMTRPEFVPLMKKAVAIITDEGGITCHAAIVSREMNKPCIIGTKIATQVLRDGDVVEVDADNGVVRIIK